MLCYVNFGVFLTFWVSNMGYFRGGVFGSKTALESAHEVEQPLIFYDSFSSDLQI